MGTCIQPAGAGSCSCWPPIGLTCGAGAKYCPVGWAACIIGGGAERGDVRPLLANAAAGTWTCNLSGGTKVQLLNVQIVSHQQMIARLTQALGGMTTEEPAAALANSGRTSPRSAPPPVMHATQPTPQYFAAPPQVNTMGGQQLQLPAPAGWAFNQVPNTSNWNF